MNDMPDMAEPLTRSMDGFTEILEPHNAGALAPMSGATMIMAQGREITAKKVAVPRQMNQIMQMIKVYCSQFGDTYVYSWEANDRKNRRKSLIEGPTIKLTNDIQMIYGNCASECDVLEGPNSWIFKAWFMDYERGVAVSRLFQQRKSQDTGMRDADRQTDIVFQIGQSKALRNVVANALSSLVTFAIEESKRCLVEKFKDKDNAAKAHAFIDRVMADHGISQIRVDAVVGRRRSDEWTIQNLARVYTEMRGIHEGITTANDVYPTEADAATVQKEKAEKDAAGRQPTEPETKDGNEPKAGNKKKKEPAAQQQSTEQSKAEPKPEPKDEPTQTAEPEPEKGADPTSLFGADT